MQIEIDDMERQATVLALAHLSLKRPGWERFLRGIAAKLDNPDLKMYEDFKTFGASEELGQKQYGVADELRLKATDCSITLEKMPHYLDRGQWLAHVTDHDFKMLNLDWADFWPRYYLSLGRAKDEIADWLKARKQEVVTDWYEVPAERDIRHDLLDSL